MPWFISCLWLVACAAPPRSGVDLERCLTTMRWLDRVEDGHAVWIDAEGVERLAPVDARAPPREGEVEVDGRPSPGCASQVRAYVAALRSRQARRVPSDDSAHGELLW